MTTTKEEFTAEITASSDEPYKTAVLRGKHTLYSDEPEWTAMPGEDAYPSPGDYLVMSLAACQVSVLNQCLEKNGVEKFKIECDAVIDEWGMDDDIPEEMPETTGLRVDHITVEMVVHTTPEYRDVADRCLTVYDEGCVVGQSIGIDYTPVTALEVAPELPA